ncbi:MAG: hypothetical protein ACLFV5_00025 [Anaerolineales bacterium]
MTSRLGMGKMNQTVPPHHMSKVSTGIRGLDHRWGDHAGNIEEEGIFRRKLDLLKARGRDHSPHVYDVQITDHGIEFLQEEMADGES